MEPDDVKNLPASWYINQPVPEKLLHELGMKPIMSEEDMSPALPASVDIRRQDAKLTKRETQVLQLISYGLNSDQIADTLHLEPSTVDYHAKKIRHVLAAKSRAHAVGIAIRSGLIT